MWESARGQTKVTSTPPKIQLALSNICNFKCVYCYDHRPGSKVPITKHSAETWTMLEKLIPSSEELAFHGIGEFMVDPKFFSILEKCAAAESNLVINTNGSVCSPRHLEGLSKYPGHLFMAFSVDAATEESYLKIRGKNFSTILQNIKKYTDALASRTEGTYTVALSFVIVKSNVKEIVPFISLAKELGAHLVRFYRLLEYPGLDWKIKAHDGSVFDYKQEYTKNYSEEYNRQILRAQEEAKRLEINIELPSLYVEQEQAEAAL